MQVGGGCCTSTAAATVHGRSATGTAFRPPHCDEVMADAADLVEVRHTLRRLVNVRGD
jgi:hypothetical protein